jgi:RND family efflux transporter MFP subunit
MEKVLMQKRKTLIVIAVVLILVAGAGYAVYGWLTARTDEPLEPTLETATVTQGDLIITADGSGELVPTTELELVFRTSGVLEEILVEVGDHVHENGPLARLETERLERAVAEADVELQIAQLELADIQSGPSDAELADAYAALRAAQVELELAQNAYEDTFDSNLDAAVDSRKVDFDWWVGYYQGQKAKYEEGHLSQADHDWAMAAMIDAEGRLNAAINQALTEQVQAENRMIQAQNEVTQVWEAVQLLQSEPLTDTLIRATLDVDQALLAREEALINLEAAQLDAPFDGIVMDIVVTVGARVGANTPILTLADLQDPLLRFWVEETDASSIAVGDPANIVFEAWPDDTLTGQVVRIDPVLVTVDGAPALQVWASLDLSDRDATLLSGMTADVEVVAAEARNALLIPVEALREMAPGQYVVFVVGVDGELETRPVTVGLADLINAEILTGLELGEVVSTGEVE